MRCPRCDGVLSTFAIEVDDRTAIVCEACGFAGVPAFHHPEGETVESWERAIERFDETVLPRERTCRTARAEGISVPTAESNDRAIAGTRLDESVAVAVSLRDRDSEDGEADDLATENTDDSATDDRSKETSE